MQMRVRTSQQDAPPIRRARRPAETDRDRIVVIARGARSDGTAVVEAAGQKGHLPAGIVRGIADLDRVGGHARLLSSGGNDAAVDDAVPGSVAVREHANHDIGGVSSEGGRDNKCRRRSHCAYGRRCGLVRAVHRADVQNTAKDAAPDRDG